MDPREASAAIQYLTTGTYVPGMSGGEKRKMRRMKTMFFYHEPTERLYFRPKNTTSSDPEECQLVLLNNGKDPSPVTIIEEAHQNSDDGGSHLSVEQTFKRISTKWWWPRYMDEIRDYIRHCTQCSSAIGSSSNPSVPAANSNEKPSTAQSSTSRSHSTSKKAHSASSSLPTMVLPVRNSSYAEKEHSPTLDVHDRNGVNIERGEDIGNVLIDGMSSTTSSNEKHRPPDRADEIETDGFVEKDEHGGVTIVIPSEPPPPSAHGESYQTADATSSKNDAQESGALDDVPVPKSTLCGECGSVIRNAGNVAVHMRRHLQYRPYHCSLCDYQGYDPDDVKRHAVRVHVGGSSPKVNYKPKPDMEAQLREMIASSKTVGGQAEPDQSEYESNAYASTDDLSKMDVDQQQAALMSDLASFYAAALASRFPNAMVEKEFATETTSDENSLTLTCNVCNAAVPHSPVPLLRHLKSHFVFDGYQCPYCTMNANSSSNSGSNAVTYRTLRDFEMHLQSSVHKTHPTVAKLQVTLDRARRLMSDQMAHFVEHAFSDAKIKCQLCSRKIAWRRQSISDHLREHSGYYPYKCALCRTPFVDLPALIEHIQSDQHTESQGDAESMNGGENAAAAIRYCPDVKAETDSCAVFPKCFPILTSEHIEGLEPEQLPSMTADISKRATTGESPSFSLRPPATLDAPAHMEISPSAMAAAAANPNRSTLRCQLCQAQISRNMSCLIAHAKVHLAYKPLKCDHCNFRHFAMSKIRRHNARVHGSKPVKVSYHPVPDIGRQIKEMKWQCFGAYGGGAGSPSAATVAATGTVSTSQLDDPALLEDEELRALHEQEMMKSDPKDGAQDNKPFHVSDILKEMIAVSNRRSPGASGATGLMNPTDSSTSASSVVSSLSSLLAERMAAYETSVSSSQSLRGAPSMIRPDNNGGIDQPVGNGLGKKLCSLCNAYIANNPSSFENHACKHLDYKPYSCHYCQYQSYIRGKVTRHIQQVHSGEQVKISHKPIPGIRDRIQAVKLACFPFLASISSDDTTISAKLRSQLGLDTEKKEQPSAASIVCHLCKVSISNESELLEAHVAEAHMPSKLYCCLSCTYRTPQLWKAKQHSMGAHAPEMTKYVACPFTEEDGDPMKALQLLRSKCFGNLAGNRFRPDQSTLSKKSTLFGGEAETDSPLPVEEYKDDEEREDEDEFVDDDEDADRKESPFLKCRLCSEMVENRLEAFKDHVKRVHGENPTKMTIFQCSYCPWQSTQSELDVKQHILLEHKTMPLKVVHVQASEDKDFSTYWRAYFPSLGSSENEVNQLGREQANFFANLIAAATGNAAAAMDSDGQSPINTSTFASPAQPNEGVTTRGTPSTNAAPTGGNGNGGGMLRKLICKLCNSTIADNPKSVGIHVKNHLNYKPYRCPFCRYMSCEQSKARRHVEHVHNANGDSIEIHAQENIKDKITEMKSRCFPNLGHMTLSDVYSNGDDAATTGSCSPEYPPAAGNGNGTSHSSAGPPPMAPAPTQAPNVVWNGATFTSQSNAQSSIFPTLKQAPKTTTPGFGQMLQGTDFMSNRMMTYQCRICKASNIRLDEMNAHVQTHLAAGMSQQGKLNQNKPYQCSYCGVRFGSDEKVCAHMMNVHPNFPPKFVYQPESLNDPEQLLAMKKRCFPELFVNYLNELLMSTGGGANMDSMAAVAAMSGLLSKQGLPFLDDEQPLNSMVKKESRAPSFPSPSSIYSKPTQDSDNGKNSAYKSIIAQASKIATPIDGRLTCQICEQAVSMNPNSLDVHVKNHLDFKPHSCAYCDYKSCIAGKVKRHLDNVHKGRPAKVDSFTKSSNNLKQIIADMRTACFPSMEGDYRSKTSMELSMTVESLRTQLKKELLVLQQSGDGDQNGGPGTRPESSASTNYNLEIRTDDGSGMDRSGQMDVFSPPMSRMGLNDTSSPREDGTGAGDGSILDTSLDEDLLSNCGTDTMSESGNAAAMAAAAGGGSYGKLPCMLCGALVADNPSSLGLHVRNHLDYKPFHCLLCDYKSCIQAKVKRHLRNVHKCPTDEMTYNPVANIRAQVTEMKIQCFPREADSIPVARTASSAGRDPTDRSSHGASSAAANSSWAAESAASMLEIEDDDEEEDNQDEETDQAANQSISKFYKSMIGLGDGDRQWTSGASRAVAETTRNDLEQLAAVFSGLADDDEDDSSSAAYVECQICGERVSGDELSKTKHLTRHVGDYEYRCQYCDYTSFVQAETMKHATLQHPKQPVRVSRSTASGEKMSMAYERLSEQCFPANGGRHKIKASIICALCDSSIPNDSEALMVHATDHVNRSHSKCPHCPYMHVNENRVKEHLQSEHDDSDDSMIPLENGDDETGKTVQDYVVLCFPNTSSGSTAFLNGGSPAAADSDGIEIDDEMEGEEDEDDLDGDENAGAKKSKVSDMMGARLMADGPRYICQLCKSPVSMYASSLYVHVKNHMNYKPYSCTRCEYRSPVKSKVRRHITNAHRGQPGPPATIRYTPKVGVEQEVLQWKKRCFPELTAVATLTNDKVPCRLCHTDVADTLLSKSVHAKNHLDAKPYYCAYCPYKSCLRGETRRHLVRQHPDRPLDVRYHAEDVAKQTDVDSMIEKCFADGAPVEEIKVDEVIEDEPTPVSITVTGSAKRKAPASSSIAPPIKKEKKTSGAESKPTETLPKAEPEPQPQRSSVYNLRTTRSSTSSAPSGKISKKEEDVVKLGPAYRDWYCCYCSFKAHSKYVVKQHCLTEHPGQPVDVSEISRLLSS